jgi:hypothetical protein
MSLVDIQLMVRWDQAFDGTIRKSWIWEWRRSEKFAWLSNINNSFAGLNWDSKSLEVMS